MKPRWKTIGTYKVMGSTTDWNCEIALNHEKDDLWNARWRGEEGAEEIFGPAKLEELLSDLTNLGVDEDELLEMLESCGIPKAREFAARTLAVKSLPNQDTVALQLMRYWSPGKSVKLEACWADDVSISRIRVRAEDWLKIAGGEDVWLKGGGYCYEGIRYKTEWAFNNSGHGEVTINYECCSDFSDSGVGCEGPIEDFIVSPKY
jgi:hypothetical protein